VLCEEMGSVHLNLLFHTAVKMALSWKSFRSCFRNETRNLYIFLNEQNHELADHFVDVPWLYRLAYPADIFSYINDLNLMMQGRILTNFYLSQVYTKLN